MPIYTEDQWRAVAAIVAGSRETKRLCPTVAAFLRQALERAAEWHASRGGRPVEHEDEATQLRNDRVRASRAVEELDKLLRRLDAGRRRAGAHLDVDALSAVARPFVLAALDRRPERRFTRGMSGSWRAERDRLTTDLAYALPVVREALRDARAAVGLGMVREVKTTPTGALRAVGGMVPVPKHKRDEDADAFQAELAAIYEAFTGEAAGQRFGFGGDPASPIFTTVDPRRRYQTPGALGNADVLGPFPRFVAACSAPFKPVRATATAAAARRREQRRLDPIEEVAHRLVAAFEARRARKAGDE